MKKIILLIGFMCIYNISYGNMKPKIKMREYTLEEKRAYLEKAIKGDKKAEELIEEEYRKTNDLLNNRYEKNYFEIVRKISINMTDIEVVSKEFAEWLDIIIELVNFENDVNTYGYEEALYLYQRDKK